MKLIFFVPLCVLLTSRASVAGNARALADDARLVGRCICASNISEYLGCFKNFIKGGGDREYLQTDFLSWGES